MTEKKISEILEGYVDKNGIDPSEKGKIVEVGTKIFEEGVSVKEAMNFSDQAMEAMYAHAYRLYQAAKYGEAGHIFRMLVALDNCCPKYYLGMGACLHRLKDYNVASFNYCLVAKLDQSDPMPLYYSSDCHINLGKLDWAMEELEEVIKRAGTKPEYAQVASRAKMTLEKLKKETAPKEEKKVAVVAKTPLKKVKKEDDNW